MTAASSLPGAIILSNAMYFVFGLRNMSYLIVQSVSNLEAFKIVSRST